jgi:hypothetical protein
MYQSISLCLWSVALAASAFGWKLWAIILRHRERDSKSSRTHIVCQVNLRSNHIHSRRTNFRDDNVNPASIHVDPIMNNSVVPSIPFSVSALDFHKACEIEPYNAGQPFSTPGKGCHAFEEITWRIVEPKNHENTQHSLQITFPDGDVDLCSVTVVPNIHTT